MTMSKVHCEKLLERAHLMGMDAGRRVGVTPMIVGTPTETFGNDIDYSKKTYFVEGGVCGFAGVVIKPARGKFVSYLKSIGKGNKHYYGGYYEVDDVIGNQYFVGKDPDYNYAVNPINPRLEDFGRDFSIICKTHYTPADKVQLEKARING